MPIDDNAFDMMSSDTNAAAPQYGYRDLLEQAAVHRTGDDSVMIASRAAVDEVFQDPKRFSSAAFGGISLGNVRPLIPLSVDPPNHSKYRKILDPLFAPKRMDAAEADIAERVNHFMDMFVDRGACHFTDEFAVPFPSAVFLGLMGLPWEELDAMLRMKDGIIRPGGFEITMEERQEIMNKTGQDIYAYFNGILDQREQEPRDDIMTQFLNAKVDGEQLTAKRSSTSASCSCSPGSTPSPTHSRVPSLTWPSIRRIVSRSSTTRRSSPRRSKSCSAGSHRCPACRASAPKTPRSRAAR